MTDEREPSANTSQSTERPAEATTGTSPGTGAKKHWTEGPCWGRWRRLLHGLPERGLSDGEKQVTLGEYQVILAVVAIVFGVLSLVIAVWVALHDLDKLRLEVRQAQLIITSPTDGEAVGLGQMVRGDTPFLNRNHYVVVTRVSTGSRTISPAFVHPDGTFTGQARFGDRNTGQDDEFEVQVLATRSTAPSPQVRRDDAYSNLVKVRRVQPEPQGDRNEIRPDGARQRGVTITSPAEGADVNVEEEILGQTSLPDLNHYIVVTPIRIGTAYVQDEPASVDHANGTFSGRARFGGAQVGVGEQFSVRVLATKSTLRAGPLINEEGTISSGAVTVTRRN